MLNRSSLPQADIISRINSGSAKAAGVSVLSVASALKTKLRLRSLLSTAAIAVISGCLLTSPASAQTVNVSVNWNTTLKNIDPGAWGVNNPAFMVPADTATTSWMNLVNDITLKKPLIRIHGWYMIKLGENQCWLNADKTWNEAKIVSALTPVINAGYKVMINIPDGPNGTANSLDPDSIGNPNKVAAWAASLVNIVNVKHSFHVQYWEIPNEREAWMSAAQMSTLINACSVAMKNASTGFPILVGGPAYAGINPGYISSVVQSCGTNMDFATCHTYGYGATLQDRYNAAQNDASGSGWSIAQLRSSVDAVSGGRHVPIFLDEFDYEGGASPYNKTSDGAVYDVLMQTGAIHSGADTTQFFEINDGDNNNSLISSLTTRYPISNYITLLNQYFYGQEVSATTSNSTLVDKFAAKSTVGSTTTYSLVLVNRADTAQTVGLTYSNFAPSTVKKYIIDGTGYSGPTTIGWPISGGLAMSARSIVYLIGTATSGSGGSLTGSSTTSSGTANLTSEGTADWIHFGDGGVPGINRKASGGSKLSAYTVVGAGTVGSYANDPRPLSWTDGSPTASATNQNGVYISNTGNGFQFTAPADTTQKTLVVHVGGYFSSGTLTAHLSDGSAADFVNTAPGSGTGSYDVNYTLTYKAAGAGQTLTVKWVMASGAGNVTINGAALVGSTNYVIDPGFESASTLTGYWNTYGPDTFGVDTVGTIKSHTGQNNGWIAANSPAASNWNEINQTITVPSNKSLTLSVWVNSSGNIGLNGWLGVNINGVNTEVNFTPTSPYTLVSVPISTGAFTSAKVFLGYWCPAGVGSWMQMDDFNLQ